MCVDNIIKLKTVQTHWARNIGQCHTELDQPARDINSPAQGFGYAVANLGLGSGG
jgi:hypothetical protein